MKKLFLLIGILGLHFSCWGSGQQKCVLSTADRELVRIYHQALRGAQLPNLSLSCKHFEGKVQAMALLLGFLERVDEVSRRQLLTQWSDAPSLVRFIRGLAAQSDRKEIRRQIVALKCFLGASS